MNTPRQIPNTNPLIARPAATADRAPSLSAYSVNDGYKPWILLVIIAIALCGAALVFAQDQPAPKIAIILQRWTWGRFCE